MASISPSSPAFEQPRVRRREAWEFRLTLGLAYVVILAGLILALPFRIFSTANSGQPGIFADAWVKANAAVPFVFMS